MNTASQTILEAFNQLPEIEKHALASEIIKQVAMLDFPPLTDEALTEIADALFVVRGEVWLVDLGMVAKVRPCLVISIPNLVQDRALVTVVTHTTSTRGSRFESL